MKKMLSRGSNEAPKTRCRSLKGARWLAVPLLFCLPFVLIYQLSWPANISRPVAVSIFYLSINSWLLWYAINPGTQMVLEGSKLAMPGREKARAIVEKVSRGLLTLCGVSFGWTLTVPVVSDTIGLFGNETLVQVEGVVVDIGTFKGIRALRQGIRLRGHHETYQLLFSLERPLSEGDKIRCWTLRRSHLVASLIKLKK